MRQFLTGVMIVSFSIASALTSLVTRTTQNIVFYTGNHEEYLAYKEEYGEAPSEPGQKAFAKLG